MIFHDKIVRIYFSTKERYKDKLLLKLHRDNIQDAFDEF